MLSRRGATLVELLVALTLAAIVLATATASVLRQQRTVTSLVTLGGASSQLRSAVALLPAQLSLTASVDDLARGELRDTVVQLRATIAAGVACDGAEVASLLDDQDDLAAAGIASVPRAGDSLWWFDADAARWTGRRLTDAWTESLACAAAAVPGDPPAPRTVLRLRLDAAGAIPALSPIRVTRQVRIAPYRSSDGTWQLGLREWNDGAGTFAAPQPLAGPLLRVGDDGSRTGFRYFDATGAALDPESDPAARPRIARIRFSVLVPPGSGSAGASAIRDSVDVALRPPDASIAP